MTRGFRRAALLTSIVAITLAGLPSQRLSAGTSSPRDPAVTAYAAFVKGKKLNYPADREVVVAAVDRLASAIEGLALARQVLSDAEFSRIHELRRDLRYLAINVDSPELTRARASVFARAARLLADLDRALPASGTEQALLEALDRSADGLDVDYPLRWQPNAMSNFLGFAATALQHFDRR